MEKITVIEQELDKLIIKFNNEEKVNVKHYTKAFSKILSALGILTEGDWKNDKLAYHLDYAKEKTFKYLDILSEDKFDFETLPDEDFDGDGIEDYDDDRIIRESKTSTLFKPEKKLVKKTVVKKVVIKEAVVEKEVKIELPKSPKKTKKFSGDSEYKLKQADLKEKIKKSTEELEELQKKKDESANPTTKVGKFFKSIFG